MSGQIARNVPNFIPMGQASGERVKADDIVELDAEGKPINPHIPQFISKAPWYLDSGGKSSLKHQRLSENDTGHSTGTKNDWYRRGERVGPAATKYRKGACENCGASSHKTRDCLERPRKVGAKWNGRDIQADEFVQEFQTTWDSKRDRTNGYDFDDHALTLKANFDRIEALRADQGQQDGADVPDEANPKSVADQTKSNSNSHMRIREDTASYLAKDKENAIYNPKSRSMKEATPSAGPGIDKQGFTRGTGGGDSVAFEKLQAFAWNEPVTGSGQTVPLNPAKDDTARNAFGDVHAQATPSQAAMLYKQQLAAKADERAGILEKYGHDARALPVHLLDATPEQQEYTKEGRPVVVKDRVRSKYVEDVFTNGHTTVWGSWYDTETRAWGYRCCRHVVKNAYCTAQT